MSKNNAYCVWMGSAAMDAFVDAAHKDYRPYLFKGDNGLVIADVPADADFNAWDITRAIVNGRPLQHRGYQTKSAAMEAAKGGFVVVKKNNSKKVIHKWYAWVTPDGKGHVENMPTIEYQTRVASQHPQFNEAVASEEAGHKKIAVWRELQSFGDVFSF